MDPSSVRSAFVIGMGEVGRRLAHALRRAGWNVREVTRDAGWEAALDPGDSSVRLLAVREEDLAGVLQRFPDTLRPTLTLLQNGFLEAVHGELGPVTRGLIYFTSKGGFFEILCPSLFYGAQAAALVEAIDAGGIPVETPPDRESFLAAMIVKGVWNAVIGLPLAVHQVDLDGYLRDHHDELDALADESARAAAAEYGAGVTGEECLRKLLATTSRLGWVRGGSKALPWRNGAIAVFGRRHGVPTPVNDRLLRAVGYEPGGPGYFGGC